MYRVSCHVFTFVVHCLRLSCSIKWNFTYTLKLPASTISHLNFVQNGRIFWNKFRYVYMNILSNIFAAHTTVEMGGMVERYAVRLQCNSWRGSNPDRCIIMMCSLRLAGTCALYTLFEGMVHNTAQDSSDNLPSYLRTVIIARIVNWW